MLKSDRLLAIFIVAMLSACDRPLEPPEVNDESSSSATMPEVNDINCEHENLLKIEDKAMQQEFAGKCLRRDLTIPEINEENCKPENIKNEFWGAACRSKGFGEPARSWGSGDFQY